MTSGLDPVSNLAAIQGYISWNLIISSHFLFHIHFFPSGHRADQKKDKEFKRQSALMQFSPFYLFFLCTFSFFFSGSARTFFARVGFGTTFSSFLNPEKNEDQDKAWGSDPHSLDANPQNSKDQTG